MKLNGSNSSFTDALAAAMNRSKNPRAFCPPLDSRPDLFLSPRRTGSIRAWYSLKEKNELGALPKLRVDFHRGELTPGGCISTTFLCQ